MLPLKTSTSFRALVPLSLSVLAATLLTGCQETVQALEMMFGMMMLVVVVIMGGIGLLLLTILIFNVYHLAKGRPSTGWGVIALVIGLFGVRITTMMWSSAPQHDAILTHFALPTAALMALLGAANIYGARKAARAPRGG